VGTPVGYPQRVPKSRYTPPSDEVAALIARTVELARRRDEADAEYKKLLAALVDTDGEYQVPVAHMADQLGVERKTVYRHTGRSMT
jgi:transcriptional regulator of acetoin/glycerol metabolism